MRDAIVRMFEAPYRTFDDPSPSMVESPSARRLDCEPVGARFARIVSRVSPGAFGAGAADRAASFVEAAGPFVASTDTSRVLRHILGRHRERSARASSSALEVLPPDVTRAVADLLDRMEFDDLVACVVGSRARFVAEMCIEFNHVELVPELVDELCVRADGRAGVVKIVEDLKSMYHGTWRNARDFEWIAKDPIDVRKEYLNLDDGRARADRRCAWATAAPRGGSCRG